MDVRALWHAAHGGTRVAAALAILLASAGWRGPGVQLHSHAGGGHRHVHRNPIHHHPHGHARDDDGHHHHHGAHSPRDEHRAHRHDDRHHETDAFRMGLEVRAANGNDDTHGHAQDPHAPALRPESFAAGGSAAVIESPLPRTPIGLRPALFTSPVRGPPHVSLL